MAKLTKEFFVEHEVLFWDQSKNGPLCPISKGVLQALARHGIKVHPVETHNPGRMVDLSQFSHIPKSAYVLYEKTDERTVIRQLIQSGVQRILFHTFMAPSANAIKECKENGIETVVCCPMKVLGTPMCKLCFIC